MADNKSFFGQVKDSFMDGARKAAIREADNFIDNLEGTDKEFLNRQRADREAQKNASNSDKITTLITKTETQLRQMNRDIRDIKSGIGKLLKEKKETARNDNNSGGSGFRGQTNIPGVAGALLRKGGGLAAIYLLLRYMNNSDSASADRRIKESGIKDYKSFRSIAGDKNNSLNYIPGSSMKDIERLRDKIDYLNHAKNNSKTELEKKRMEMWLERYKDQRNSVMDKFFKDTNIYDPVQRFHGASRSQMQQWLGRMKPHMNSLARKNYDPTDLENILKKKIQNGTLKYSTPSPSASSKMSAGAFGSSGGAESLMSHSFDNDAVSRRGAKPTPLIKYKSRTEIYISGVNVVDTDGYLKPGIENNPTVKRAISLYMDLGYPNPLLGIPKRPPNAVRQSQGRSQPSSGPQQLPRQNYSIAGSRISYSSPYLNAMTSVPYGILPSMGGGVISTGGGNYTPYNSSAAASGFFGRNKATAMELKKRQVGGVSGIEGSTFSSRAPYVSPLGKTTGAIGDSIGSVFNFATGKDSKPALYRNPYKLSEADLSQRVINTIAGEARSSQKSTDAVIHNMINRIGGKGYADSLFGVATQPGQYSGYQAASQARANFIRERIRAIASGKIADPTGGANEFRTAGYRTGAGAGQSFARDALKYGVRNVGGNDFVRRGGYVGPYSPYSVTGKQPSGGDGWGNSWSSAGNQVSDMFSNLFGGGPSKDVLAAKTFLAQNSVKNNSSMRVMNAHGFSGSPTKYMNNKTAVMFSNTIRKYNEYASKNGLPQAMLTSSTRFPLPGQVGGMRNKNNSLHASGMAGDVIFKGYGLNKGPHNIFEQFAQREGLYAGRSIYGAHEAHHYQSYPGKRNPFAGQFDASGKPKNLQALMGVDPTTGKKWNNSDDSGFFSNLKKMAQDYIKNNKNTAHTAQSRSLNAYLGRGNVGGFSGTNKVGGKFNFIDHVKEMGSNYGMRDDWRTDGPLDKSNLPAYKYIGVHHTGTKNVQQAIASAKNSNIGYQYIVDKKGQIHRLQDPNTGRANHWGIDNNNSHKYAKNYNSLGIAYVGDGNINDTQRASMTNLTDSLRQQYGIDPRNILGHGEVATPGHRSPTEGLAFLNQYRQHLGVTSPNVLPGSPIGNIADRTVMSSGSSPQSMQLQKIASQLDRIEAESKAKKTPDSQQVQKKEESVAERPKKPVAESKANLNNKGKKVISSDDATVLAGDEWY